MYFNLQHSVLTSMRTYNTMYLIKHNLYNEIRNYPHTNSHHGGHFKDNYCLNEID